MLNNEPGLPTNPAVAIGCNCVKWVNRDLVQSEHPNTMVETNIIGPQITFVLTCKRDERVRGRPKRMFATYCPFCGKKYATAVPPTEPVNPGSLPNTDPYPNNNMSATPAGKGETDGR